jgi:flagellar biosynthetic protein FliR
MLNPVLDNFETFFFVFVRVMAIFMMIPFFGGRTVPVQVKLGLAVVIGLLVAPTVAGPVAIPDSALGISYLVFKELLIGFTLGLIAKFVFTAFEIAGQIAGIQMGFSVANVIDPHTSGQLSVLAQFYNIMGILIFFSLNVHLVFISAIKESFDLVGPFSFALSGAMMDGILAMSADMFKVALKLSAPISVAILLANIAMGVLARTVPQLNIFVVGFPVTITLGLIVLVLAAPFMVSSINKALADFSLNVLDVVRFSAVAAK